MTSFIYKMATDVIAKQWIVRKGNAREKKKRKKKVCRPYHSTSSRYIHYIESIHIIQMIQVKYIQAK